MSEWCVYTQHQHQKEPAKNRASVVILQLVSLKREEAGNEQIYLNENGTMPWWTLPKGGGTLLMLQVWWRNSMSVVVVVKVLQPHRGGILDQDRLDGCVIWAFFQVSSSCCALDFVFGSQAQCWGVRKFMSSPKLERVCQVNIRRWSGVLPHSWRFWRLWKQALVVDHRFLNERSCIGEFFIPLNSMFFLFFL